MFLFPTPLLNFSSFFPMPWGWKKDPTPLLMWFQHESCIASVGGLSFVTEGFTTIPLVLLLPSGVGNCSLVLIQSKQPFRFPVGCCLFLFRAKEQGLFVFLGKEKDKEASTWNCPSAGQEELWVSPGINAGPEKSSLKCR
ncbi:Hypothetical predicted protein [Podarcis lilfordi]|uniref:Uncharacterized protein n=1 Tax=Podarcis lilfordi TaxID=74358 RepID=A0AA35LMB4_9SAUR|nr:Hypothetical predicted protein [Podarcis lilfordi]